MTVTTYILFLIVAANTLFAISFVRDLVANWSGLKNESGSNLLLTISSPIIFFLSALGISDFALSTILYRYKKVVTDKLLPGTLNTQCVIPVAVMALSFISIIKVDVVTLVVCIVSQVTGAYLGPRFVIKLSIKAIRMCLGLGLIISSLFIIASKCHLLPAGGVATGLSGAKLMIAAVCLFIFGSLNNIGIGSYAPSMVTIYLLGMNPLAAFPIMMGASTFSVSMGSMQFIKYGQYNRKVTLFSAVLGVAGVLAAVFMLRDLNVSVLQWLVAAILLYSGISMLINQNRGE